jgi:hypothetical protein
MPLALLDALDVQPHPLTAIKLDSFAGLPPESRSSPWVHDHILLMPVDSARHHHPGDAQPLLLSFRAMLTDH